MLGRHIYRTMLNTEIKLRYYSELHSFGGVHIGLWVAMGHRIGTVDKKVFDKAARRIMQTEPYAPGTIATHEFLSTLPISSN